MRIFVSYAHEQLSVAERLTYALRSDAHKVFFAEDALRGGDTYGGVIREEILSCQLFVFLLSPQSVSARYSLSELDIFQKTHPVPGDRVLPVIATRVPMDSVPNYLRPLTILTPKGDIVAEIQNRIAEIAESRRRRRRIFAVVMLGLLAVFATAGWKGYRVLRGSAKPPQRTTLERSLSLFHDADQSSEIVGIVKQGEDVTVTLVKDNPNWVKVNTKNQDGWAMAQDIVAIDAGGGPTIALGQGYGYKGEFWSLYFTSPQKEGRPPNQFGIDMRFADAIRHAKKSIDIAVYEFNNQVITDALLEAHHQGVAVRVVTGQFGYEEHDSSFSKLEASGIAVVVRPEKFYLMHNKFAVLDGATVWTGSWNYTDGATYKNNENAIALEGQDIAQRYEMVFNQMFAEKKFGVARKPAPPPPVLHHGIQVMFAPEDPIVLELIKHIQGARRSIQVMAFAITLDTVVHALTEQSQHISVRGILEPRLAQAAVNAHLLCVPPSKIELRFGSSPRYLHHDVLIIDDELVVTGSTNFAHSGTERNDENILFIPDASLAKKYDAEFSRLWAKGTIPDPAFCKVKNLSADDGQ